MNSSIHRFSLDLQSTQSQISIPVMLRDTGRTFRISLSDGGNPYLIADGCLAKISIKRPTGSQLEEFCDIEDNTTVVYPFSKNKNTAAVEGIHDCDVTLYGLDEKVIGSSKFTMVVSERVVAHDDIVLTDEDHTAIDAAMVAEAARVDAEKARVTAEEKRVEAETARVNAETARANAEKSRTNAESLRAYAETARDNAEKSRAEAESVRVSAEEARESAEAKRVEAFDALTESIRTEVKKEIPNNVSQLTNDAGYITKDVEELTNFFTKAESLKSLKFELSKPDFKLHIYAYDANENEIASTSVDFPLESAFIDMEYDDTTQELMIHRPESTDTLRVKISDIVVGLVSESRTIAGIDLKKDISKANLLNKLELDDDSLAKKVYSCIPIKYLTGTSENPIILHELDDGYYVIDGQFKYNAAQDLSNNLKYCKWFVTIEKPMDGITDAYIHASSGYYAKYEISDDEYTNVTFNFIELYRDVDTLKNQMGDVDAAFDELHTYAQNLVNGGEVS